MISLEAAQKQVLELCHKLNPQKTKLAEALGNVSAQDVQAQEQVPTFDNTAMDGFALMAEDTNQTPCRLKVVRTLQAGDAAPDLKIKSGEAVRIMTGAPIPAGADAVVMVEKTNTQTEDNAEYVYIQETAPIGNFIRRAGENISVGQVVLQAGEVLTSATLGVLASLGIYELLTYPKCRVGVMSTGSELVEGSQPLNPGQIRDANRHMLLALLEKAGMISIDLGLVADTEKSVLGAFKQAAKSCDALLTSGGVSMGDFDYVKKVLITNGGSAIQIAIKPSKPLAYGRFENLMVFGLPGNPVSSVVSFELFARPGLRAMMGFTQLHKQRFQAVAMEDLNRMPDGKVHFARVIWEYKDSRYEVRSAGQQGSHQLQVLAESNGLAVIEDGTGIKAGQTVDLICL